MEQWSALINAFLEQNQQINLSAIRDVQGVYDKHICDALVVQQFDIIHPGMNIADVGTGGGRPLLALAQLYPQTLFTGIDARRKKMEAVQTIADAVGLSNIKTLRSRIEEVKQKYDVVTARAVAYADVLLPWIHDIVHSGGLVILYKLDTKEESDFIIARCKTHGYTILQQHHYVLHNDPIPRTLRILKHP